MEAYFIHLATLAAIYVMMTLSFNFVVGYAGLVNFGHIGLMAIGAYASTILVKMHEVSFFLAAPIAALLTMLVALLLALPAKKIKGDYYALVTLGFMFVMQAVLINWDSLTRGTLGIPGVPRPEGFADNFGFLILTLAVTLLVFAFLYQVARSPFGRALEAVRDDEEVAAALGKPVFKLKVIAMLISGAIVGLSGAFLAHFVQFIAPNTFWLELLVWALAGMMVGGLASMRGSVLGIVILFAITEPLRFLDIPSSLVGPLRLISFMTILLALVIYRPKGLMGRAQLEG